MIRKIFFYIFITSSFITSTVYATSYEDGLAAYESNDFKKAAEIWQELAEQGNIPSQLKMAELYSRGSGVKRDRAAAFKLYNSAADRGSLEAMFQLGLIYMSGQNDIKQDQEKGRDLIFQAANKGYAKAQYHYGITYFRGEGVLTDYVQAHAWMQVSIVNGYESAKKYSEQIAEILSAEQLEKSRIISEQLLADMGSL